MRKILTILGLICSVGLVAQPYNNEWINFSNTYYKFKVGANGLYRISQPVLAAAGLGATPVQNFQLFRNGQEVPIYTSASSGVLGPSDYLEFWGRMNDGKPDNPLYRNSTYQLSDHWSLQTDTAEYFLTVNSTGLTIHYDSIFNNVAGNVLPVEQYFMYQVGTYFRNQINPGWAQSVPEYIYSSAYDIGEGWTSNFSFSAFGSSPASPVVDQQNNLYIYNGGPNATLVFGAAGCSDTTRQIQVMVNGQQEKDTILDSFNQLLTSAIVPLATLNTNTNTIQFNNLSNATTYADRLVVSFYTILYPRQYNFGGAADFFFELPAKAAGYYLNITNFNLGAAAPVLYDVATGQRYTAVIGPGNILEFAITGSAVTRKLVLVSEDPSNIISVTSLTVKNFTNFSNAANQGNYIIISNPQLYTGSSGNNPVNDYKNYRSSSGGGGFQAQVIDINELVDQFGFGIKKHPSSVKNFLNYARNVYGNKPQFVLLLGRGMAYPDYRSNESNPADDILNPVPTFGYPASDQMLSSVDGAHDVALTPIGRVPAISGPEVEVYLNKLKEYEGAQLNNPNTVAGRDWMKTVVHVTGATDPYLEAILCGYMANYQLIIAGTFFGANVYTLCSSTVNNNNQVTSAQFPQLFSNGIAMMSYFGHSDASALGFNLDDPTVYNNQGKYPVFYVNGCYAGNYYVFDPGRLAQSKTLSEAYTLTPEKGSMAFIASTSYGIVDYLAVQLNALYNLIGITDYGKSIGAIQSASAQALLNQLPNDFLARSQAEEMNIDGDPAVRINSENLPDYDIEPQMVKISPAFISVSNSSFNLNATFENLGKAINDSIEILITRKYPNGTTTTLLQEKIPGPYYKDSVQLTVPIVATRDKGPNSITVTVNVGNVVPEVTYANNSVTTNFFIYQDALTPIFPYNYAIVDSPRQKLWASTANPLAPATQYIMEIDTTELYNSPALVTKTLSSIGGALEFDPGISYRDSTVYYWRTSIVPQRIGVPPAQAQYQWNEFSFIYLDPSIGSPGFNQSHYFQHLQSTTDSMSLGSNRIWQFGTHLNNLYITQTMYPTGGTLDANFGVSVNGNEYITSACVGHSLVFNVFNPVTFIPWKNVDASGNNLFLYGSGSANCQPSRNWNFEFSYMTAASRKLIMNFMNAIPNGYYVVVRSFDYNIPNSYAATWEADTALYGSNQSLYHYLKQAGFLSIDAIDTPRDWALIYKKNDLSFIPESKYSQGIYDQFTLLANCPSLNTEGSVLSPKFGPARQWKQLHWRGYSLENPSTDQVNLQVLGVDTLGNQTPLYSLGLASQDFDISAINPLKYPYLQLRMQATDTVNGTPYQLNYWRLNYNPVPEGALAPNLYLSAMDTLGFGQFYDFGVAFKNVSIANFDSMLVNLSVIDKNNVTHVIPIPRKKALFSGDTLKITNIINSTAYPGQNTLFLFVNPNNDQPEQFLFNNFMYQNFYVKGDNTNPLLDVTFDNIHILNGDIVSARPHVQIKLTDESKYLLLNDTSEVSGAAHLSGWQRTSLLLS